MSILEQIKGKYNRVVAFLQKGRHMTPANVEEMDEHECLNCHTTFRGDFCPRCGQSARTKRLTIHDGIENITAGILKFNKGMSHSIVELIYRPGYMAHDYIKGYRKEYYPPIALLTILVAIPLLLSTFVPTGNSTVIQISVDSLSTMFSDFGWAKKTIGFIKKILLTDSTRTLVVAIVTVPFIWLTFHWTKVGRKTNWAETLYLSVFIACNKLVYSLLLFPFELLTYKLTGNKITDILFGNSNLMTSATNTQDQVVSEMHTSGDLIDIVAIFLMIWIMHSFYKIGWLNSTIRVLLYYILLFTLILLPDLLTVLRGGATIQIG